MRQSNPCYSRLKSMQPYEELKGRYCLTCMHCGAQGRSPYLAILTIWLGVHVRFCRMARGARA
jgi:hypothetical protein